MFLKKNFVVNPSEHRVRRNNWTDLNFSGIGRGMQGLAKFCIHLAIAQGTLPWQPTKVGTEKFSLSRCHSQMDWNIAVAMGSLKAH